MSRVHAQVVVMDVHGALATDEVVAADPGPGKLELWRGRCGAGRSYHSTGGPKDGVHFSQRARLGASVQSGAVVFVQRFTKTLSVYPHLHVLVLDGGYTEADDGYPSRHPGG